MNFKRVMIQQASFAAGFGLLIVALALTLAAPGAAHERRELDTFDLVFGWRSEPAIAGELNGPEVFIRPHEGQEIDFENPTISLQAEVSFGPASRVLNLRPAFRAPDHYIAELVPTLPGDYTFRITGSIGDTLIDETFTSADGMFHSVEPASDIMFPEPLPDAFELLRRIEALEAEIEALKAGSPDD